MNRIYDCKIDEKTGGLSEIILKNDENKLNFVFGEKHWGEPLRHETYGHVGTICKGIFSIDENNVKVMYENDKFSITVIREFLEEQINETYVFKNISNRKISMGRNTIGFYSQISDRYPSSTECMKSHCHAHLWCGGENSYICALRMNGKPKHLGVAFKKGDLQGYCIEKSISEGTNYRGEISVFVKYTELDIDEEYTISTSIFFHNGMEDFKNILVEKFNHIDITADKFVANIGDDINFTLRDKNGTTTQAVKVTNDGEQKVYFNKNEKNFHANVFGIKSVDDLLESRARFIIEKQQVNEKGSMIDGAYICYDNGAKEKFVGKEYDQLPTRERVGMGAFLAKYYSNCKNESLKQEIKVSLDKYYDFIIRETVDEEFTVYNEVGRDNGWHRMYNYPLTACYMLGMYSAFKHEKYLLDAANIMKRFFAVGGLKFYAILVPVYELLFELEKTKYNELYNELLGNFREYCDHMIKIGLNFPPHEVNYEQSIIGPAIDSLLQFYRITKEQKYLDEANRQLPALVAFCGQQPDCRLNEIAIRHWDIYWFGKARLFGDTFPHYWSAINSSVYYHYSIITNDKSWQQRADRVIEGNFTLFTSDGFGSAGYMYPYMSCGKYGKFLDNWANDQDWALYYCERFYKK